MAGLEAFHELPLKQRIGIIAGVGVVVAAIFSYLLYDALGTLGPAKENMLSSLLRTEAEGSIWGEINTLEDAAKVDWEKGALLPVREEELRDLLVDISKSRELLPTESQKGKIIEDIANFVAVINQKSLCELHVSSIKIIQQKTAATRRKKKGAATATKTMYKCELVGDINGILSFVEAIEAYKKLFMTVDGLKLKPGKVEMIKDDKSIVRNLHKVTVEVNTWVLPE